MNTGKHINHLYSNLLLHLQKNKSCVIATVTSVMGSTPQIPGSSAIFGRNGLLTGTVGGGATELSVAKIAQKHILSKKNGYFQFNLNHKIGDNQGPICGGGMHILMDANPEIHLSVFESLCKSLKDRKPGVLLTIFSQNDKELQISREWFTSENQHENSAQVTSILKKQLSEMLHSPVFGDFREICLSKPGDAEKQFAFLEAVLPHPILLIAGAGHVGKALSHIGRLLDFEVVVWDSRPDFATVKNLPEAHQIYSGDIDLMKNSLKFGKDTFAVIVTHGHDTDAEVLKAFIQEDVAYIGMMGSRRKIAQVGQMFFENSWATNEQWKQVYTPIGIEIGSKTVNEIAISIAAQLIQVRNGKRKRD